MSWIRWLLCASLQLPNLLAAQASDENIRLSQYVHTAWRLQDGAFDSAPNDTAQTKDGYIWVGTRSGLLRFDGVHFVAWPTPPEAEISRYGVIMLIGTEDGSLWIGGSTLLRLKDGKFTTYSQAKGHIAAILDDHDGGVWIARYGKKDSAGPLCHVSDRQFRCFNQHDGITFDNANDVFQDKSGAIWVAGTEEIASGREGVFQSVRMPASAQFKSVMNVSGLAEDPDGSILVSRVFAGKDLGIQSYKSGRWAPYERPGLDGSKLNAGDTERLRDGSLWIGSLDSGLVTVRGNHVDHYRAADGLSSDAVNAIFEDRESNVWVTTSGGLDRFHIPKMLTYTQHEGLTSDVADPVFASRDGTIYIGNNDGIDVIREGSVSTIGKAQGFPGRRALSIAEDHAGKLWLGIDEKLMTFDHGHFHLVTMSNGAITGHIDQVVEDSAGNIWAVRYNVKTHTLLSVHDYTATEADFVPGEPNVAALSMPQNGSMIVAYLDGSVAISSNGVMHPLVPAGGPVMSDLMQLHDGHIVGMAKGSWISLQDEKEQGLGEKNGLPCSETYGFVQDQQGTLWLYMSCGLVAIEESELGHFWKDPHARLTYRIFDRFDGVHPGRPGFRPVAALGSDGKLWFANGQAIQMIDPRNLRFNPLPPPVHVDSIAADRKLYQPQPRLRLPKLTREVEIDYTALSFSIPEKVHFRYRLEEHDTAWQDAGTRREAFYNDLPPGHYRFQVIASNDDGVWNTKGDTLDFSIAPAFYQTVWFKLLMSLAFVGLLGFVYALRVRRVTGEISVRLGERLRERERIAADLHDTFLQDFQAVILRVQVAANRLFKEDPNRKTFEEILDYADQVLADGRNHIRDLRSDGQALDDLPKRLAAYGEELSHLWPAVFSLAVTGEEFKLHPSVRDDIYLIGREAIGNAFKHSNGTNVEVTISYSENELKMRIIDDGVGIEVSVLQKGRPGHLGLHTMRERARKIGATLNVSSEALIGTIVEVTSPKIRPGLGRWVRLKSKFRTTE